MRRENKIMAGLKEMRYNLLKIEIPTTEADVKNNQALDLFASGWYQNSHQYNYYMDKGVYRTVCDLLNEAVVLNNPTVMYNRGYLYLRGVPTGNEIITGQDRNKAYQLLDQAIELEHSEAMVVRALEAYFYDVHFVTDDSQRVTVSKKVNSLLNKAIALNNPHAMQVFAFYLYKDGNKSEQTLQSAIKLYDRAIELNYPQAMYQRAELYEKGLGEPDSKPNYQAAFQLYQRAVELNHDWSMYNLAIMYEKGLGTPDGKPNNQSAIQLYQRAGYPLWAGLAQSRLSIRNAFTTVSSLFTAPSSFFTPSRSTPCTATIEEKRRLGKQN
jgi:TPR repeat protein